MDEEEIERLVISIQADNRPFLRRVAEMREQLETSLGGGAERAGRSIENALLRATRTGKFGFDDLKRIALGAMDEIARAAVHQGIDSATGGQSLASLLTGLVGNLFGAPGRATGGPVSPGRPYWVGERGPELFVPASAGSVAPSAAAGPREVRVVITVHARGDTAPQALAQSSRQVARAVKAALAGAD